MLFLFDLDGTITTRETLPMIAEHFSKGMEIESVTNRTITGEIPFERSFPQRVDILKDIPVSQVAEMLRGIGLHEAVRQFIAGNAAACRVVTGNLDCWCAPLVERIGCRGYFSQAIVEDDRLKGIGRLLDKAEIVDGFRAAGEKTVFIGDGDNDYQAMSRSDVSIASGLTHTPAQSICGIADYVVADEAELITVLTDLLASGL